MKPAAAASPSSRRAWVEIPAPSGSDALPRVALLAEGVGRNCGAGGLPSIEHRSPSSRRAWVEIHLCTTDTTNGRPSPSSRRAWVEIMPAARTKKKMTVALLAEGVGRNKLMPRKTMEQVRRPPRGGRG